MTKKQTFSTSKTVSGKKVYSSIIEFHLTPKALNHPPKKKILITHKRKKTRTIPLLLESPKSRNIHSPALETDLLFESGGESNVINITIWKEIQTLHPKLFPSKISSKPAAAQGATLKNYGSFNYFLFQLEEWNKTNF